MGDSKRFEAAQVGDARRERASELVAREVQLTQARGPAERRREVAAEPGALYRARGERRQLEERGRQRAGELFVVREEDADEIGRAPGRGQRAGDLVVAEDELPEVGEVPRLRQRARETGGERDERGERGEVRREAGRHRPRDVGQVFEVQGFQLVERAELDGDCAGQVVVP